MVTVIGLGRSKPVQKIVEAPAPLPVRPVAMLARHAERANPAGPPAYDLPSAERAGQPDLTLLQSRFEVVEFEYALLKDQCTAWRLRAETAETKLAKAQAGTPVKRRGRPPGKKRAPAVPKTEG